MVRGRSIRRSVRNNDGNDFASGLCPFCQCACNSKILVIRVAWMLITVLGMYSILSLIELILSDLMRPGKILQISKKNGKIDDVAKS